jgi:ferredoxin
MPEDTFMTTTSEATIIHKVYADTSACCGYGLCAQMCPEIYKLNEQGIVYLETDTVPPELLDAAIEGADCCPATVLRVVSE